jgi:capsular exopolysaccharide synthesis family protein
MEFAIPEAPARAFLFTSAGPGEGKSLTVANLAIAMSQMGRRVLVIDADLRNSTQHKLFELAGQPGLTEVLTKKFSWRDARASTGVENLDVIPCRQVPPNPAELLGGQAMRGLLEEAKLEYDVVLVDSPPVLLFTDACVLAPLVNGVLLVVRASVGTPEAIARGQALLQGVRGKVVGAILNAIPSEGIPHYGFYGYHRYYSPDDTEETKLLTNWEKIKDLARDILSRARRI